MTTSTAYLTLSQNGDQGSTYQLAPKDEVRIGRASENDVVLSDERCSRYHALIYWSEDQWYIRDLGSRNGTIVDEQPLMCPRPLESGSQILIGHTILNFEVRAFTNEEDYSPMSTGVFGISNDSGSAPLAEEFDPSTIIHHRNKTSFLKSEGDDSDTAVNRTTKFGHGAADLCKLAFLIGKAVDIDVIAKTALEGLLSATNGSGAGLWLFPYNEKGEQKASDLRLISNATNTDAHYTPISESLANTIIQRKEAVLVNENNKNVAASKGKKKSITSSIQDASPINNTLAAPIRKDDETLGLIHLYNLTNNHVLDLDDLEYTLAVADTVAVALGQLNRQKELQANLKQAKKENSSLRELLHTDSEIIGSSNAMKRVGYLIGRAADGKATLLIRGESGTGKELIAKAVHFASPRKSRPMVCINCAAIAESLLASELFGHEKGAFTGATDRKAGKFEAADTGTLFLDEIGEMPILLQSKLLRILEGHPFERVGGNTPISVDVRVIAATNRDLEREVAEGRFRHDLFFRLRVLEIIVPPLRKRTDDIPIIAEHFLDKFSKETGRKYQGFAPDAMDSLMIHRWPGNVRELKNVIERAVVLGTPPYIQEQDLLLSTLSTTGETDLRSPSSSAMMAPMVQAAIYTPQTLEEVERNHIQKTLEHTQWNKSLAARTLGIERTTLDRKIKRYEIEETTKTKK